MRQIYLTIILLTAFLASSSLHASGFNIDIPVDIIVDESLADHEVVVYALSNFKGSSAKVSLGVVTAADLKKYKVYNIRSIKIGPRTKFFVFYTEREKESYFRSKEKMDTKGFTRVQIVKYGDFSEDPVDKMLADPNNKIKGVLYNSLRSKNVSITKGRIDSDILRKEGMNFFKSYELAPGYEMTAYAFTGFKGESQVVRGKGTLSRLCSSLILRKIDGESPDEIPMIEPLEEEVYAVLQYTVTKKQIKIKPGNYDHDQLKSNGLRFVQAAQIPDGYELWAYPFSGFRGDPVVVSGSGKLEKMAMSVKLKKKR